MFDNTLLRVGVFGLGAFIVCYAVCSSLKSRKRALPCSTLLLALFAGFLAGGIAYQLQGNPGGSANWQPFANWMRVKEIGYGAIWSELAGNALPFLIPGLLLPFLSKRFDNIWKAGLFGVGTGVVLGVLRRVMIPPFNVDEVIGAVVGILLGFSFTCLLRLFFSKSQLFRNLSFKRLTHYGALAVIFVVYFSCVGLLLVDSGSDFEQLNIFKPDHRLPGELTITAQLSEERGKEMTYSTVGFTPAEEAERLAALFGFSGTAEPASANADISVRAKVEGSGKKVTVAITGEWQYEDSQAAAKTEGVMPSAEQAAQYALDALGNGCVRTATYVQDSITLKSSTDEEGNEVANRAQINFHAQMNGRRVRGSAEATVVVGLDGDIVSISKYNADFEPFKEMTVISSAEAWQQVLAGNAAHTLFRKSVSAEVSSCEIAYWLEEVKGVLQPIWLFQGKATTEDGEQVDFEIFVPALDY